MTKVIYVVQYALKYAYIADVKDSINRDGYIFIKNLFGFSHVTSRLVDFN